MWWRRLGALLLLLLVVGCGREPSEDCRRALVAASRASEAATDFHRPFDVADRTEIARARARVVEACRPDR